MVFLIKNSDVFIFTDCSHLSFRRLSIGSPLNLTMIHPELVLMNLGVSCDFLQVR